MDASIDALRASVETRGAPKVKPTQMLASSIQSCSTVTTGGNFDIDNSTATALLVVLRAQTPALERVLAIVNLNFLPV